MAIRKAKFQDRFDLKANKNHCFQQEKTLFFSTTNKPLIITVKIGFFISFVSFSFGILIGIRKIFGSSVPPLGWTSLIISIWFLFGLIILNMGILGLYISRIFNEAVSRPVYIIDEILNFKNN